MFLLKIIKNPSYLSNNLKLKNYLNKLKNKIILLKILKEKNNLKNLQFLINSKKTILIKQDLITHIFTIYLSKTNTIITITNVKGNLILNYSSGLINLKGKQKKKQPLALTMLLKLILSKTNVLKNKPIAINFKNVPSHYETLIINILKTHFFIKAIKSYNMQPHNGCRPKKIKRIKKRKFKMKE